MGKIVKVFDREKGIQAVIKLQAFVGITELRTSAEQNWDQFTESEKEETMQVYSIICEEKEN